MAEADAPAMNYSKPSPNRSACDMLRRPSVNPATPETIRKKPKIRGAHAESARAGEPRIFTSPSA